MTNYHSYAFSRETRKVELYRDGEHIGTAVTAHPFTAAHAAVAQLNGGKAAHAATVRTRKQEARAQQREAIGK